MIRHLITAKHVGTILLWVVALLDGFKVASFDLSTEQFVIVIALAVTGSFAWIHRTNSRPADEVYLAGKAIGRREAELEQECANVTRMAERPSAQRLRVVD